MQIHTLELFLYIASCHTLSQAARQFHLTQPAVSQMLASLEREVGQTLITRKNGQRTPITLTDAGKIFHNYADQAITSYREMLLQISRLQSPEGLPPVKVHTSPTISTYLLPSMMSGLRHTYPELPIQIETFPGQQPYQSLLTGKCQVVITSKTYSDSSLICEPFFDDPLVLVCPVKLKVPPVISLQQFRKLPFIFREPDCGTTKLIQRELKRKHVPEHELNIVMQVFGIPAVIQAVLLGNGCGFAPQSATGRLKRQGVIDIATVRELRLDRKIYLARRENQEFTATQKVFWDYIYGNHWRNADTLGEPINT